MGLERVDPRTVAPEQRNSSGTSPTAQIVLQHLQGRHQRPHQPTCHPQHPHHHDHIRPRYVTPPTPTDSTLTIDTTGNTSARYIPSSTPAITNRTTTLTISITDTTRVANTTSDSNSDNTDRLTQQPGHQ